MSCQRGSWWTHNCVPPSQASARWASVVKLTARHGGWWHRACSRPRCWLHTGRPERRGFRWQDRGTRLKVTGIELFSAGVTDAEPTDTALSSWDPLSGHYRRLLIRDGKLHGVLLMGNCRSAAPLTDLLDAHAPANSAGYLTALIRSHRLQD